MMLFHLQKRDTNTTKVCALLDFARNCVLAPRLAARALFTSLSLSLSLSLFAKVCARARWWYNFLQPRGRREKKTVTILISSNIMARKSIFFSFLPLLAFMFRFCTYLYTVIILCKNFCSPFSYKNLQNICNRLQQ